MSITTFLMLAFAALCFQMFVGLIQVREIRNALRDVSGQGIIGMGHNKTMLRPGRIVILYYDPKKDVVVSIKVMKGYTNFAKFKEIPDYTGMNLEELRYRALEEDKKFFKHRRKHHPYSTDEHYRKKGALIQAVEQIDLKMSENSSEPIRVMRKRDSEILEH